jgi:hypothetical protein
MTAAQKDALGLVRRNGRYGVGEFGGIPTPTAKALVSLGLVEIRCEKNSLGKVREYLYPK